ncbi:5-oxoprolinase subunit PxpA [Maribacter aurantiacus]|uniref:5-oxoprolinase subunit PxpA n=1 Tax=Maribacter aurantiacus TaxID=1882343 RepID=A0A5R8M589_9FLAO|nr:5-oxoprolinase subunit PxpA [Maribacter aurantiacus]TLF44703.1 5-oxoprolinase subunit PxpA [Maribacter aurantiacus]
MMTEYTIDINCDVGEGVANEAKLFPYISSCNIACGGHTGDRDSMRETLRLAKKFGVGIGAHPSYPDRENFGRKSLSMDATELSQSIKDQIHQLASICKEEKVSIQHIKPHGALYNDLAKDGELSRIFLDAIQEYKSELVVFVPFDSVLEKLALKEGFQIKVEAFADRNYTEELTLVPRTHPNALITEPLEVLNHVVRMVKERQVRTIANTFEPMLAQTYCVHGDTPEALQILTYITKELPKYQIALKR